MRVQALKLADELFDDIDSGLKCGTIRAGIRDIELGELVLEAASGSGVTRSVSVERVTNVTVANLTNAHAALDGYSDVSELWRALRKFYPNLAGADVVTAIEFSVLPND